MEDPTNFKNSPIAPDRLRLLLAAEKERTLTEHRASTRSRTSTFVALGALFALAMCVVWILTPSVPKKGEVQKSVSASPDLTQLAQSLASAVDSAAAPSGLSPSQWVSESRLGGVASAFVSQASFGMTPESTTFAGNTATFKASGWFVKVSVGQGFANVALSNDSVGCVTFGVLPLAPSTVDPKRCDQLR